MSHFFSGYALFLAQILTFIVAIVAIPLLLKGKGEGDSEEGEIKIKDLNNQYAKDSLVVKDKINPPADKEEAKQRKTERKEVATKSKTVTRSTALPKKDPRKKIFVLDFKGDLFASQNKSLRREVDALLYDPNLKSQIEQVVIRLDSPGGTVIDYGLTASLVASLKEAGIPLVVCVDRVAASGGYLVACVADQIVAAPQAIVGSIGTVMEAPNFHRLLDKLGVSFHQWVGGEFKRPYSPMNPVDPKGHEHLEVKIAQAHREFAEFVFERRSEKGFTFESANGDHWSAKESMDRGMGLVDTLMTSDTYLRNASREFDLYLLSYEVKPKTTLEKFQSLARKAHTYLTYR